jgi:hypothetical protein
MVGWSRYIKTALVLGMLMLPGLAAADLLHSTDYQLDPDVADNFGGTTNSTSYQLTDSGGEAVVGAGSSQSYQLSQGYQASLPQSISLSVLPHGTVAYYPLDTGTGDEAYDVSANQNNGAIIGSPSWVTGKIGDGLALNGTSQYVTVPSSSSDSQTGTMTIEAWVKLTNYTNTNEIVSKTIGSGSTNNTFELRTQASTGDLQFLGYDTALETVTSSSAVPIGSWEHVAVTKTGTTATLYINGAQVGSGTVATTTSNSNNMVIGGRNDFISGYYLNGSIDEVRLYNSALTTAQIAGDYSAGVSGLEFAQTMPPLTPGTSVTYSTDCVVRTDAAGYQLSIQQPSLLLNSDNVTTLPAISGASIGSPQPWTEGTTKGFGFTVTAGTDLESAWGAGPYNYAAVPASDTVFHSRGSSSSSSAMPYYAPPDGTPEVTTLQFRADASTSQKAGTYTANIVYTATLVP